MRELMMSNDLTGIRAALEKNPGLANEGVSCFDANPAKAHPLHRICDGVHNGIYSDEDAIEMAKIFLEYSADINGVKMVEKRDTPLIAAASLNAEKTGIFYISRGADIFHPGTHGGTALHWAAWVGRDKLVKELIEKGAEINRNCIDFKGTPLLWAVHGYKNACRENQVECARLLIAAGADKTVKNFEGYTLIEFLDPQDIEMIDVIQ
jgi:uncharacterized protein